MPVENTNPGEEQNDSQPQVQPELSHLRRRIAEALDESKPVFIFPPESAYFLEEEMGLDPAEVARTGYLEVGPEDEGDPMVGALLVHFGHGHGLPSELISHDR